MSARPASALTLPPGPVAAGAIAASGMVGLLLGARPHLGVGLLIALLYAPLVMINLRIGVAVFVVLVFLRGWSFISVGPTAASILILFGWLGSMRGRADWTRLVVSKRMLVIAAAFFGWLTLSALWARDSGDVFKAVWLWYVAGLTCLIVMTSFSTRRSIELLLTAFVAGAVIGVVVALFTSGFAGGAADPSALQEGRLVTGHGDPNDLAAGIVPAIIIAAGLFSTVRSPLKRWPIIAAIAILALGLAGTESRGGFLGAVAAVLAACVVFKRRRAQMVVVLGVAASLLAIAFTITPGSWARVTSFQNGGSGRADLWHVAWRVAKDNPVAGVGVNNFRVVSRDYVRQPGNLDNLHLVIEQPHLVHNQYLERLSETGVVGLGLFLCLIAGSLAAARRAARNFERRGERALATLSRSVLVATVGFLACAFFLSAGTDARQWILLAIGPAMLALSRREAPALEG